MVPGRSSTDRDRNLAIYVTVIDGATFGELASSYGISRVRVQKGLRPRTHERLGSAETRRNQLP
jgi:hypothetical protein